LNPTESTELNFLSIPLTLVSKNEKGCDRSIIAAPEVLKLVDCDKPLGLSVSKLIRCLLAGTGAVPSAIQIKRLYIYNVVYIV